MSLSGRVQPEERGRFILLALLFFINAMVMESNEVVATSGFISSIGVSQIVVVWAIDMTIVIITSGIYSLFVDRTRRARLAVILYFVFTLIYLSLYAFFAVNAGSIGYGLLLVINDQQWLLFPLLIWALANDMFSISEAKRLFPVLGIAAFSGGIVGNAIAASMARFTGASYSLLVFNAMLMVLAGLILMSGLRRIKVTNRRAREGEKLLDSLREGLGFVREVPIFRYLTIAMILLGIGLNAIEFDFLSNVSATFVTGSAIQSFYGGFKIAVAIGLLILQGYVATRLLNRVGFKHIFVTLPTIMISSLMLALFFPSILGVVIGNYAVRVTKLGIDEPAIKAFQGLVPDERRGRVGAFMDGYLYPLGSIISCFVVGTSMLAVASNTIPYSTARVIYLGVAGFAGLIALILTTRIAVHYDSSMLNWRLKRRRRDSAAALEGSPAAAGARKRTFAVLDALVADEPTGPVFIPVTSADALTASEGVVDGTTEPRKSDGLDDLLAGLPARRRRVETPPPEPPEAAGDEASPALD